MCENEFGAGVSSDIKRFCKRNLGEKKSDSCKEKRKRTKIMFSGTCQDFSFYSYECSSKGGIRLGLKGGNCFKGK